MYSVKELYGKHGGKGQNSISVFCRESICHFRPHNVCYHDFSKTCQSLKTPAASKLLEKHTLQSNMHYRLGLLFALQYRSSCFVFVTATLAPHTRQTGLSFIFMNRKSVSPVLKAPDVHYSLAIFVEGEINLSTVTGA